jgi:single-stranded DNA-specific DHH superfamily exonuclease
MVLLDNPLPLHRSDCYSAAAQKPTLIVPDKDADGLSSGVIVHRTLVKLGLDPKLLDVHLVQKGSNIHEEHERKSMLEKNPSFVIILDQGSRGGPPVIDDKEARSLIVDHHLSDEFPQDAIVKPPHILRVCCSNSSGRVGLSLPPRSNYLPHHVRDLQKP